MQFQTLDALRAACVNLPSGDTAAEAAAMAHQATLTKPAGSLGRLEELVAWLARWQGRAAPRLEHVSVVVFAGNHGVATRGVSAYPATVTAQMVDNFAAGGAAINQLARLAGARLEVVPLELDCPTGDFTLGPALDEADFMRAVNTGAAAVKPGTDLVALGEMGIGNTTVASALAAGLFGGGGERWCGRGTGVDAGGLERKRETVDAGLARHTSVLSDRLAVAAALGGRELAALLGATLAARYLGIPVLLDGFVATAAVAPLGRGGLAHCRAAHRSAEAAHGALLAELGLLPLLDLDLRLGEGSGAALAVLLARAALACHAGMASFADAGVDTAS